jgi:hypothetical protein
MDGRRTLNGNMRPASGLMRGGRPIDQGARMSETPVGQVGEVVTKKKIDVPTGIRIAGTKAFASPSEEMARGRSD